MPAPFAELLPWGWTSHFALQLDDDELSPVRVLAVHRDALEVAGTDFEGRIQPFRADHPDPARQRATVGDWLLLDPARRPRRLLERLSLFRRKAPGTEREIQLIAANVDTVFLVTSANDEFNIARLERYLAIAREARVFPVVVITKADLVEDVTPFREAAQRLGTGLVVETLDARMPGGLLDAWLACGQTVALLGSSGVGKSTLINHLTGTGGQATAAIRETDAKGRHTTSSRSLHRLPGGAWLVDTPGMRELQLVDAAEGIREVFDDLVSLAAQCRFADCQHDNEPGCAVQEAIAEGAVDPERLARYRKLLREERHNTESVADSRARERAFGKMAKDIMAAKHGSRRT